MRSSDGIFIAIGRNDQEYFFYSIGAYIF